MFKRDNNCKLNTKPKGFSWLIVFGLAISLVLAGCGGSSSSDSVLPEPEPIPIPDPDPDPVSDPPPPDPDAKSAPEGIYHSAGRVMSLDMPTVVDEVYNTRSYVNGTLVKIVWSDINPSEWVYDFRLIERELEKAAELNTAISLAIADSKTIPEYIIQQCETFNFTHRGVVETTCLPWDETYQFYKAELISRLGDAFDSHPNLSLVYFSYAAMTNGMEMQWRVDEDEFARAGYTMTRLQDSYNDIMDIYINAFTKTPIALEVHSVFEQSTLAESAYEYCYSIIGERCGVAMWWCASRMATDPSEPEYLVWPVAQLAANQSFAVCQTIGSYSDRPDRFDQGQNMTSTEVALSEIEFFTNEGVTVFEFWTSDLDNPTITEIMVEEIVQ